MLTSELVDDVEGLTSRSPAAVDANAHRPRLLMKITEGYADDFGPTELRKEQIELMVIKEGRDVPAASFQDFIRFLVGEMCELETALSLELGDDFDDDNLFSYEFLSHIESLIDIPGPFKYLFQRGFSSYTAKDCTRKAQETFDRVTAVRAVFLQRCGGAVEIADVALEFLVGNAGRDLASFLMPPNSVENFMNNLGYQYTETFEEVGPAVLVDTKVRDTVVGVQAYGKFSGNSDGYAFEPVWIKWRVAREGEFDESDDEADANESYHADY